MKQRNLDKRCQISGDAELLAGDRNGEVSAKRSPQLESDGDGCRAIKGPDPQAVFELAKEQFDLSAVTILLSQGGGADRPLIGPKNQPAGVLEIVEADAAQKSGPVLGGIGAVESDGLVGAKAGGAVNPAGCRDIVTHIGTISNDKEGPGLGDASQATKVDEAAVHDVEYTGLDGLLIEPADIAVSSGVMLKNAGIRPRRSSAVWIITAASVPVQLAHRQSTKFKFIIDGSSAMAGTRRSSGLDSSKYSAKTLGMSLPARCSHGRRSRYSLARDKALRVIRELKPI